MSQNRKKPERVITLKQQRFCKAYVANGGNGQEAAKEAGYKGNDKTLRVVASENLTKTNVQKYLSKIVDEADRRRKLPDIMCIDEVLARTSFLGRCSLDMVLDGNGQFDIEKAKATGGIYALKQIQFYKDGTVKAVSLRDKNASLEIMGKHHGLWTGEIDDPWKLISDTLGIPMHLLPTGSAPMPPRALGEFADEDPGQSGQSLSPPSPKLPAPSPQVVLDTNDVGQPEPEVRTESGAGKPRPELETSNEKVTYRRLGGWGGPIA